MKSATVLSFGCLLLLAASGCSQKVNDPTDVQTIKDICLAWDEAWNACDAERLATFYVADAIAMGPNQPARVGRNAIRASSQRYFDQVSDQNRTVVEGVRVSGDLAIAWGTQETKTTPKAGGHTTQDRSKWITSFQRQRDGSWKILWECYNSDLPAGS